MIWDHPRAGNHATASKLRVRPSQNYPKLRKWHNREESRKFHNSSHFRPWKYILAVLTQQIMWMRPREKLEWLVELIWASSGRVIRWQDRASSKISKKARKCSHQLFESFLAWSSLVFWNSGTFVFIMVGVKDYSKVLGFILSKRELQIKARQGAC